MLNSTKHSWGKGMIKHDDYMTKKSSWESLTPIIGENGISDLSFNTIYESAYGDGTSGKYLQEVFPNKKIIHGQYDYFKREIMDYDIEISNPPFSIAKEWLTEAKARNKPFIFIMPTQKIITQYFRKLFCGEKIQILIPRKRMHFDKLVNGKRPDNWKSACCFDCYFYTWGLNLKDDINWLDF